MAQHWSVIPLESKIFDQPWPISINEEARQSSIKIRLPDAKSESKWVMILALRWQSSLLISCNLPSWDTEPFKSGHNHYQNMNENQITFISQSTRTWMHCKISLYDIIQVIVIYSKWVTGAQRSLCSDIMLKDDYSVCDQSQIQCWRKLQPCVTVWKTAFVIISAWWRTFTQFRRRNLYIYGTIMYLSINILKCVYWVHIKENFKIAWF